MLSLDVSKVFPTRAYTYLAALIPGLFFESSILLANPELISKLAAKSQQGFALGHYTTLGIALFLAFVIGNAFMLLVGLIQHLLGYFHRFCTFLREEFCRWPLFPLMNWLLKKPFWNRRQRVAKFHRYVVEQAFAPSFSEELGNAYKCWRRLARKLLKTRYGIELDEVGDEWQCLYWSVGTPTAEDIRGSILMMASHATGWCGLAATRFAPALNNRYYLAFSLFMIGVGLQHDYYVARRRNDPLGVAYVNTRALLREYRKRPTRSDEQLKSKPEPEVGET